MNDDKEQVSSKENAGDFQPCCEGGSCCPSESNSAGKSWKIVVFIIIVLAAGVVLARSFIRKSDSVTEQGTFVAIQSEVKLDTPLPQIAEAAKQGPTASKGDTVTPAVANEKTEEDVSDKASLALWGSELDSLASLNKAAADIDAVFVLLAADDQESNQTIIKQIEAAAQKIKAGGIRISAFRLKQSAPNYANFTKQLSTPCVIAMVKGGGLSGVSADQITETKLVQAFVAASRPSSGCCPPGSGASCP
ncbi:MAG: SDR family oxidoreductase [Planctomycetes bacterium]|nr:SDR family oxidoreductase [Planctomycetota bacterium]